MDDLVITLSVRKYMGNKRCWLDSMEVIADTGRLLFAAGSVMHSSPEAANVGGPASIP